MPQHDATKLTHAKIKSVLPAPASDGKYRCPKCNEFHLTLFVQGGKELADCKTEGCDGTMSKLAELVSQREGRDHKADKLKPTGSLTLQAYTAERFLNLQELKNWYDARDAGSNPLYPDVIAHIVFPSPDHKGEGADTHYHLRFENDKRTFGKPQHLYGGRHFQRLEQMAEAGDGLQTIFLVEGQSNTHTMTQAGYPTLGLPGVKNWKPEWAELKLFQMARRICFLLDMKDGTPEDVAIVGARNVAECFPAGKVLAVKLPMKAASDLWMFHMGGYPGGGLEGFKHDLEDAVWEAKPVRTPIVVEEGFPADLGPEVLDACPILKDFVAITLPTVESDLNMLICDFLAHAGVALGLDNYATFATDRHPAATFHLLIAETSTGKGQAAGCTEKLFEQAMDNWRLCVRSGCRSAQALIRMLNSVSTETITTEEDTTEHNPQFTHGKLLLRLGEASSLFRSTKQEWSTLSETLREAYDGRNLSNELGQEENSRRVTEPYVLGILGDITPWELNETIQSIDFENGSTNRWVWCVARKHQTLSRSPKAPNYTDLARRLNRLLHQQAAREITYSETGAIAWDAWVASVPEDTGRLGSACARFRANALRLCVLFAMLDEGRLLENGTVEITDSHVRAASAVVNRHRETVKWFLARRLKVTEPNDKEKLFEQIAKLHETAAKNDGKLTGTQLRDLFSNVKDATERERIAAAAGLKKSGTGTKTDPTIWS